MRTVADANLCHDPLLLTGVSNHEDERSTRPSTRATSVSGNSKDRSSFCEHKKIKLMVLDAAAHLRCCSLVFITRSTDTDIHTSRDSHQNRRRLGDRALQRVGLVREKHFIGKESPDFSEAFHDALHSCMIMSTSDTRERHSSHL